MHSLICAFVVRIGYKTRYCMPRIKSLLPETEVSRYLQASLCDLVHLKNRFFDDAAHILHDSVLPDHCRLQNT